MRIETNMKKVLVITTVGLDYEGITSVIYNYTNAMDKSDLEISFLTFGDLNLKLKEKFEKMGEVFLVSHRKRNVLNYIIDMKKLLKQKEYDVVHVHGNSGTMFIEVLVSKLCNIKKIIVHCHNTSCSHPIANMLLKLPMNIMSDVRIACSKEAGEWLYGRFEHVVFNNAVDLNLFKYDDAVRNECRKELGIDNQFLLGHVGHFREQKNHSFLIDIFSKFREINLDSALLLLSDGPDYDKIKQKVCDLGLSEVVYFVGRRDDIHRWYQAMDLFLFPSLWEGLGMVLIEAQASGLPCITSENIPVGAKVTDSMLQINLAEQDRWIEEMERVEQTSKEISRKEVSQYNISLIDACGYSISTEADKLRELYLV